MKHLWLGSWFKYLIGSRLAPFVPTPVHVGRRMLQLADVREHDRVYDLGCGDGSLILLGEGTPHSVNQIGPRGIKAFSVIGLQGENFVFMNLIFEARVMRWV